MPGLISPVAETISCQCGEKKPKNSGWRQIENDFYPNTTYVCGHCKLPNWPFLSQCELCEKFYLPRHYPDYDGICFECIPPE